MVDPDYDIYHKLLSTHIYSKQSKHRLKYTLLILCITIYYIIARSAFQWRVNINTTNNNNANNNIDVTNDIFDVIINQIYLEIAKNKPWQIRLLKNKGKYFGV